MSRLDNLIGFWNNKSSGGDVEKKDGFMGDARRPRPKSDIMEGGSFSRRMEFFDSPKNYLSDKQAQMRGVAAVKCDDNKVIKDKVKCSDVINDQKHDDKSVDISDVKIVITNSGDDDDSGADHRSRARDTNIRSGIGRSKSSEGNVSFNNYYSTPPLSPLCPGSSPSTPTSPTSPSSPGWSNSPKLIKTQSPFAKFKQLETNNNTGLLSGSRTPPLTGHKGSSSLYRNLSMPASTPRPSVRIQDPGAGGQSRPGLAARSGSGAKEMILMWVQARIKDYPIPMTNFSTCWNDGLAFCALIHVFYPDNFDWFSLKKENRRHNFTLAFEKAEELAGIYPLLEVDDMVRFQKPDWKCVFTYVQSFYRRFRNGRSPSPRPGDTAVTAAGGEAVKLSEVAQAVAECQAAEEKGKQIVKQISVSNKVDDDEKPSQESDSHDDEGEKTEPSPDNESQPLIVEEAKMETKEEDDDNKKEELHTGVASITLSQPKLSPDSKKMSRSKSLNHDSNNDAEKSEKSERKFSTNHPMPSSPPPALNL